MLSKPKRFAHDLNVIIDRCSGAYSDMTLRGYRNDLLLFKRWCEARNESWLPATAEAVARFVDVEAPSKSIATLKRRVSAIQFAHRMTDLPSPINHSEVRLAVRRAARAKRRRPEQALGLTADLLRKIVLACPATLAGLRDAALLTVGYDTLCRSSELVAMRVEHLGDDMATLHVPRSKSDPYGDGRTAYLSPTTAALLQTWLLAAGLQTGPLFRGLHTTRVSPSALDTSSVRRRIKLAANRALLCEATVAGLSGHSMRVGAAQDMMLSGSDTIAIMQAGGWRTHGVVARYVENASAQRIHQKRWDNISDMHL